MPQIFQNEGKPRIRRWLAIAVKLLIAGTILYFLYSQGYLNFDVLTGIDFTAKSIALVVAMLALVAAALLLMGIRLRVLLKPHGITLSLRRSLQLVYIGALSGSVLPGVIAGDAVKAIYLFDDTPGHRSSSVSCVLFDRVIGLSSLLLLGTSASVVGLITDPTPDVRPVMVFSILLLVATVLGAVAATILMVSFKRRLYWRFHQRVPRKVSALLKSLYVYRDHPAPLVSACLLSLLSHSMIVISFILAAILLSEQLPFAMLSVLNPLAMLLNAVPLTPGGLGITESGFAYLYQLIGSENGAEVALLGRLAQYTVFVIGGLRPLLGLSKQENL